MIRKPCVAYRFYPGDRDSLLSALEGYMPEAGPGEKALAVIAPHAGYMYSAAVAGAVYGRTAVPERVVVIGPNHTGLGERAAVMASGTWQTPLGPVEIDRELAMALLDACGLFSDDASAHMAEHAIEVQLPFIMRRNARARIVPVTLMHTGYEACAEMGAALADVIGGCGGEVLMVVSSDMNHYESDRVTRNKDRLAIEKIKRLDARGLLDVTSEHDITMCGVVPAAVAIEAAVRLDAVGAKVVSYATSAETSGDYNHVVGYAGVIIK
ncbi:MAG TPA: AmmeMemoRadiSam system protein B [Deltaproteobacteria bacterium]|nr:AmmeMemoRadiSam system protein B [Deltaproteobacteria bacterium]